jgi:hemolysin D
MKSLLSAPSSREPAAEAKADEPATAEIIRIFQSEAGEIRSGAGPIRSRKAVLLACALFVSLLVIAGSFRLNRVVTSIFGQIVTVAPTTVMQPFDESIIKTINVRQGARVKKGQLLATLDQTIVASSVDALRLQIASLNPEIARCEAELGQRPFVYVAGNEPSEAKYAALQQAYYLQRKAAYDAQLKSYEAQIAQYQATIHELAHDGARYGDRAQIAQKEENMQAELKYSLAFSLLELLQAKDYTTEMKRNMEADLNNIPVNQHTIESTQETLDNYIQQWRAATSQELVTARNARDAAQEQLQAALKHLDVVRLYAPDDALVLRVAKLSVGSVMQPGDDFIELASLRSPVEAEIYINPVDIGFVRPGDDVTLKLDPFAYVEHGWAEGKVNWISEGTYTTMPASSGGTLTTTGTSPGTAALPQNPSSADVPGQQSGTGQMTAPFYMARVRITKLHLKDVPKDARLYPGATLTADIHVGTRSVFWYMFSGLTAGVDQAMREP